MNTISIPANELDEIRERYALATAAAKVGVWDWNMETGEFYLDPNIKGFLGYEDHEIPNDLEVWTQYIHPDDKDPVMKAAQETIEGRRPEYIFEHRMVHKDGSERWILVRGSVIRDAEGKPLRFVGTDADITDRKLLEKRISDVSDEIQTRIGHDLHDSVAQELTGLSFLLKSLEKELSDEGSQHAHGFREIHAVLDEAIGKTRSLALGLSPVLKGPSGLAGALEQLGARVQRIYGIDCNVNVDDGIPIASEARASELYRIAQEAVANAVQHSGAERIGVTLQKVNGRLTLRVEDDGTGISTSNPEGMGLKIMDYRARSLGGALTLQRRETGGTLVECTCPWEGL